VSTLHLVGKVGWTGSDEVIVLSELAIGRFSLQFFVLGMLDHSHLEIVH
jgi:hypothetical protein